MSISPHIEKTEQEKRRFFCLAAKRYKAECRLYGVKAMIHIENKNDEVFWGKMLHNACPQFKFRFIAASRSVNGNLTAGCSQALNYRPFLDPQLWIAIDSDYRRIQGEADMDAGHFILQTYTYSFENHFCWPANLQRALFEATGQGKRLFDFEVFISRYSHAVWPVFLWLSHMDRTAPELFSHNVFHRQLALPVNGRFLDLNGDAALDLLEERCRKLCKHFDRKFPGTDLSPEKDYLRQLHITRDNAFLFVRGHQLYDCLVQIGEQLQRQIRKSKRPKTRRAVSDRTFESHLLRQVCFGAYPEIDWITEDIRQAAGVQQPPETTSPETTNDKLSK